MPRGVYQRTEFHSKRISEGRDQISRVPKRDICEYCGREYLIYSTNERKYCSLECSRNARKGISVITPEGRESLRKRFTLYEGFSQECLECGKEFITNIRDDKKFCCQSCMAKYWWKHRDNTERCQKISQALSVEKKINVCQYCHKEYEVRTFEENSKYCSLKCFGLAHRGEKASGWKGGIQFKPYPNYFNEDLKESIRERDDRICQLCNKTEDEELLENGQRLSIHHIDYNKDNCNSENLISLCAKCHSKTQVQREYWENLFKEKVLF